MVEWLYPPWYQKKLAAWKRGEIDWDGNPLIMPDDGSSGKQRGAQAFRINKITMLLRLDSLPSLFTFINLLGGDYETPAPKVHKAKLKQLENVSEERSEVTQSSDIHISHKRPLEVDGLRIVELTQRTSTVRIYSQVH